MSAGQEDALRGSAPVEEQHSHHDWGHAAAWLLLQRRGPRHRRHRPQRPGHQAGRPAAGEMDSAARAQAVRRPLFSSGLRAEELYTPQKCDRTYALSS